MRIRPLVTTALLVSALAVASTARADDRERARELFDQAIEALTAGRAAEGRDLLRESAHLHAHVPTMYNLAVALRRTGEPREAVQILEALLGGEHGELDDGTRGQVQEQLDLARAEVSLLMVGIGGATEATIEIDGENRGRSGAEGLEVPVDPGDHVVVATTGDGRRARVRVSVGRGETAEVEVPVPPRIASPAGGGVSPAPAPAEAESGGAATWPWIAGGVALVVGAAVVAVLLLPVESTADPVEDPVTGIIVALE